MSIVLQEYRAAKKQRKQEKERRIALLQLQSKKNGLLTKQLEQQKSIVKQVEKSKDDKLKKELLKVCQKFQTTVNSVMASV